METKYDFTKQNNKSFVKEAEKRCCQFLTDSGKTVINVADNPDYYKYGIDIIIKEQDKKICIDVKADTVINQTNNIFYELIECFFSDKRDFKIGWAFNKYLSYIYYVDVVSWKLYIISLSKLNNFIYNKQQISCRLIPHLRYKTIGFLIPLWEIKDIMVVKDLSIYGQGIEKENWDGAINNIPFN